MSLNNSMDGDERLRVGACASRTSLSPTRNMRSRKNRGAGLGVGNENDWTINSPDPKKKKGMFYFIVVHIVCKLFIVCILILQL